MLRELHEPGTADPSDMEALPKVELHLHLDTSLSYDVVSRLRPSVSVDEYRRDYLAPSRCANLADFLRRSPKGFGLMQTRDALRAVVEDIFAQLARDNVIYAELRFAPLLHLAGGLSSHDVVHVVDSAVESMSEQTGIEARIILCTLRHFSEAQSLETVYLVHEFNARRVVAFDIAGDEAGYSLDEHKPAFDYAHERGLHTTAHAGEARGPESVWETLARLKPGRIGHGVRSCEDPLLVDRLVRDGVHLEVCPSSNVQLVESISEWAAHPIERLRSAGVSLNVNCDNRMLNNTSLNKEYAMVRANFAWTPEIFEATNVAALRHAFVDLETKRRLLERLFNGPHL